MPGLNRLLALGAHGVLAAEALAGRQRLSILIFHRVLPTPEPVYPDGPDAAQFDRLMTRVARQYRVLSLGDALSHLQQRTLPRRALVITFDDGYADNAELALPILKRHGLTATVFVTTGFLDGGCMWNDRIIHMFRRCTHDSVDLAALGLPVLPLASVAQREHTIVTVLKCIKYMPLGDREQALSRVAAATGVASHPQGLMMTTAQVQQMHRAGIELGGHTVHHPILTELDRASAGAEIAQGRDRLQQMVDAPIEVFAYPNGRPGQDYAAEHVQLVRQAGFKGAVTTAPGTSAPGDDLFQLPRFSPWDTDPDRWAARLVSSRLQRRFDTVAVA